MLEQYLVRLESTGWAMWAPLVNRLDPGRREAIGSMKRADAKVQSLCAHLLARALACRGLGVSNATLDMAVGGSGKPFFPAHPGFHFSLAHTTGGVAVAVADRPVGVDIEAVRPVSLGIAKRFFTAAEAEWVLAGGAGQSLRLLEVWTRKEACVKWEGTALAPNLRRLDVLSDPWRQRLGTTEWDGFLLSLCCEQMEAVPPVTMLPPKKLWEYATKLEPFRRQTLPK